MRLALALALVTVAHTAQAAPLRLTHQGRALDADGAPIHGPRTVVVALYDGPSGPELWRQEYAAALEDGFYAVTLEGADATARPLDTELLFGRDVYVAIEIGGVATPRQHLASAPYAGVAAAVDGRVRLASSTADTCASGEAGTLVWNPTAGEVRVCDGADYVALGGADASLEVVNGAWQWGDGTLSTSCQAYRSAATAPRVYGGEGSGLYRVDPDGSGPLTAQIVYCDQVTDNGGWTMVWKVHHQSAHVPVTPGSNTEVQCDRDPYDPVNVGYECNVPDKWSRFLPTDVRMTVISDLSPAIDYDYVFTEPAASMEDSDNVLPSTTASHYRQLADRCAFSVGEYPSTAGVAAGFWLVKHPTRTGCCQDIDLRNAKFDANCGRHGYGGPGGYAAATSVLWVR